MDFVCGCRSMYAILLFNLKGALRKQPKYWKKKKEKLLETDYENASKSQDLLEADREGRFQNPPLKIVLDSFANYP